MSFCEIHHHPVRQEKISFYEIMLHSEMDLVKEATKKNFSLLYLKPDQLLRFLYSLDKIPEIFNQVLFNKASENAPEIFNEARDFIRTTIWQYCIVGGGDYDQIATSLLNNFLERKITECVKSLMFIDKTADLETRQGKMQLYPDRCLFGEEFEFLS